MTANSECKHTREQDGAISAARTANNGDWKARENGSEFRLGRGDNEGLLSARIASPFGLIRRPPNDERRLPERWSGIDEGFVLVRGVLIRYARRAAPRCHAGTGKARLIVPNDAIAACLPQGTCLTPPPPPSHFLAQGREFPTEGARALRRATGIWHLSQADEVSPFHGGIVECHDVSRNGLSRRFSHKITRARCVSELSLFVDRDCPPPRAHKDLAGQRQKIVHADSGCTRGKTWTGVEATTAMPAARLLSRPLPFASLYSNT